MSKEESQNRISRRDFLKGAAAGIGAAALAGLGTKEAKATALAWEKETDVLVIGSGYAGLAAAIEAFDAGASVTILEKMPVYGGNSIISEGAYNAVDPVRQKAQGIEDSVDLHFEQTIAAGDYRGEPQKVRYLVEHALEGWQWLEGMGVQLTRIFQIYGALWPRTHQGKYKDKTKGWALAEALHDQAKVRGIPILLNHKVTEIIRYMPLELRGSVLGVEVEGEGKNYNFKAKKALVLTSGGFCADVEMRARHDPRFDGRFATTNQRGATGEILNMAEDIGADETGMDFIQSIGPVGRDVRYTTPPTGRAFSPMNFLGGLTVNYCIYTDLQGKRIVAADARRDHITEAVMRTPEKVCVSVTDEVSRQNPLIGGMTLEKLEGILKERPHELFRADSIRELAQKLGMPDLGVLEQTVTQYNSYVDAKNDPEFGQQPHNLIWKCGKPPFWAATGSPALHHMCGGLRTKGTTARVLDRWNDVIPGLYAAGEIVGGVHGTNRVGANAIADCIVFGRVAGRNAASEKPWSD